MLARSVVRGRRSRLTTLIAVVALAAFSLAGAPAAAAAAPAAPSAHVHWAPCEGGVFQCATVSVPLDYDRPNGASILLSLIRLRATNPGQRIGSLLVNPGGPGGSGVDLVLSAGQFFPPEIRARFDLVGFDPRGIARSTPLRCFGTPRQWGPAFWANLPLTPSDVEVVAAADRYLADACQQRGGRIIDHMTTADVARDMDLLRAALGDERLSYLGFSYGSMLGTTYANLFPDRVRAIVVDGVLDPIAWTTGAPGQQSLPFSTRLRSDQGAQATLGEFFRLCDQAGPNCAFSGNSAARFAALRQRLLAGPILVQQDAQTVPFTYTDLIFSTLGALYSPFAWPFQAELLALLEASAPPAALGAALADVRASLGYVNKRGFPRYPNFLEGFPGVACPDSDNPHSHAAWFAAAEDAEARFGYFGRAWTWASSICAVWPGVGADRYTGPWNARTANPVLVVGNYFDPATRYQGAQTVAGLLPNSRLLSYAGWGHTVYWGVSSCVDAAVNAYLVNGVLPPAGTVCQPEIDPFAPAAPGAAAAGAELRRTGRAALLPEATKRALRG
ncbi:MAG TPA: alpha/beta hydrolase [Actinomycetota bacterium]|jgi:pimeloyl-ACP methyl ester carboxylesterase